MIHFLLSMSRGLQGCRNDIAVALPFSFSIAPRLARRDVKTYKKFFPFAPGDTVQRLAPSFPSDSSLLRAEIRAEACSAASKRRKIVACLAHFIGEGRAHQFQPHAAFFRLTFYGVRYSSMRPLL
jgi:hypothetical protein